MKKNLHPRIQELKDKVGGEYLTCRYVENTTATSKKPTSLAESKYKDDPRVIEAYLAVWGVKDSYGTIAVRGCFAKSIAERGPKSNAKDKIIHLFMHDKKEPVGSYIEMVEDDYGLYVAFRCDDVAGTPERVLVQTKSGTINQYSYGFRYIWDKMEYDQVRDAVLMYECNLYEGTSVTVDAACVETYTIRSKEDLTKILKDLGQEAEEVLSSLSRTQQMEVRQLITRYKSLAEYKPIQKESLDLSYKPTPGILAVGDFKINLNNL